MVLASLGQQRGVTPPAGQHRGAQPDPVGGLRQSAERGERSDLVAQVIGHREGVVAVLFGGLGELDELARTTSFFVALAARAEAELAQALRRGDSLKRTPLLSPSCGQPGGGNDHGGGCFPGLHDVAIFARARRGSAGSHLFGDVSAARGSQPLSHVILLTSKGDADEHW